MAEFVKRAAIRFLLCTGSMFCAVGLVGAAENLPDPTRPPASLASGSNVAPVGAGGPVLQSVLISSGRKIAVISGQTVQTGDRLGDARVARIAEGEVVLVRGGQSQTLKLFPGIEKRQTKNETAVKQTGRRQ